MTTANTSSKTPKAPGRFRLPDIPDREPDEVTQFDHIAKTGNAHYLAQHLGNPESTLVEADRWIAPDTDGVTLRRVNQVLRSLRQHDLAQGEESRLMLTDRG